jgi:hypothetical protein
MNQTQGISKAAALARKVFTKKPFLIFVALIVIYTLTGFLLTPYLVKRQLTSYVVEQLGCRLRVEDVRVNPYALTLELSKISLMEANDAPVLSFDRLFVNFETKSLFRWAWTFAEISLNQPTVNIEIQPDGRINLIRLLENVLEQSPDTESKSQPKSDEAFKPPRFYFERITIAQGHVDFTDRSNPTPAQATIKPINLEVRDITTIPNLKGPHTFSATLPQGGTLEWKGDISLHPIGSEGQVVLHNLKIATVWRFLQDELNLEKPDGVVDLEARYRFKYEHKELKLTVDQIDVLASALAFKLRGTVVPILALEKIHFTNSRFELDSRRLTVGNLVLSRGKIVLLVAKDGKLNWEKLVNTNSIPDKGSETTSDEHADRFHLGLKGLTVENVALKYLDQSRLDPIGMDLDRFDLKCTADLAIANGALKTRIENIFIDIANLTGRQANENEKLFNIKHLMLRRGHVDLNEHKATIDEIVLADGQVEIWRDIQGKINWIRLATGANIGAISKEIKAIHDISVAEGRPWSVHLPKIRLERFGVRLSDRGLQAPEVYNVRNIHLNLQDLRTDPNVPFKFDLNLDVAEGGHGVVNGTVNATGPSVELSLDINAVELAPLQPYLNTVAKLDLDSGNASLKGDLQYGIAEAGAVTFTGRAGVNAIRLTVPKTKEPLVSWKSMDVRGINLTNVPKGLVIREVLLKDASGKLLIREDQSTNIEDVLVTDRKYAQKKSEGQTFPLEVKRLRFQNGKLDFTDLSLVPQFAASIHALNGSVAGLSSQPDRRASLELKGRVDEYGSAEIEGTLQPFEAKDYSDVTMVFRNIDLSSLTPYAVKFAGRYITDGRLALDLNYKIKKRQLKGENQIILDHFVLGERVEGPNVIDIPLDLAIALLKDPNDRIDLQVPVSGNLEDPDFSYGHLILNALKKLVTKIATAPFRALAGIFGSEDETLDTIEFEAGTADLQPPEADKLATLAKALLQRPQLALEVQGNHHPEVDGTVFKATAVKHELTAQMGFTLESDQDPGPLNFSDSATQQAIETLARMRLTPATLEELSQKFGLTPPEKADAPQPTRVKADETPPPADPTGFYTAVFNQLVDQEPLDPDILKVLAQKRALIIIQELTAAGGVDAARVKAVEPGQAEETKGEVVATKLILKIQK